MQSKYFTLKEAIYLPQWTRVATADDGLSAEVLANLDKLFKKMDLVREYFDAPIIVHCAFRPKEYNKMVLGAANSAHLYGMACDFHVKDKSCDDVRQALVDNGLLDQWGMRCEDAPGTNWVHLDIRPPSPNRYFKP